MDHLDSLRNHSEIVCCFMKILLEYKRNSLNKIFLPRYVQIPAPLRIRFLKKIKSESALTQKKITGYPLRILSVPSRGDQDPDFRIIIR